MSTAVLKFGGSSVATLEKMQALAERLALRHRAGEALVVVVSAMGKSTDALMDMAHRASHNPSKRELDLLLSTGEQVSIALFTMVLKELGLNAIALTGAQAGVKTRGNYTKNTIEDIEVARIQQHLAEGLIVLVAGFQGINAVGDITTLGRGGSDTSAVAIAAKLGCPVEIYTDVQGIYGVDPRRYPAAQILPEIAYEEMKEMAWLGAKVMEPRSIDIAQRYRIPIYVAHAHEPVGGTWILAKEARMEEKAITGVSLNENVLMVNVRHLPRPSTSMVSLFSALAHADINVDMITQTMRAEDQMDVAFTTSRDDMALLTAVLNDLQRSYPQLDISVDEDCAKVSVVGEGMRTQAGVAAQLFALLSEAGIEFKLVTTSEISISYTLAKRDQDRALTLIAEHFKL